MGQQSQQQQQDDRRIRFSVVEEFEYEVDEYTDEERNALWYTMEDMVALVKHEMELCHENNRKEGCTWRGLEHMQTGEDERQERVAQLLDSALDAYDEICMEDDDDDSMRKPNEKAEQFRNACRALTREDRKRAYKYGLRDASVAEKIQQEPPKKERSSKRPIKKSSSKDKGRSSSSKDTRRSKRVRSKDGNSSNRRSDGPATSTNSPAAQMRMNPIAA